MGASNASPNNSSCPGCGAKLIAHRTHCSECGLALTSFTASEEGPSSGNLGTTSQFRDLHCDAGPDEQIGGRPSEWPSEWPSDQPGNWGGGVTAGKDAQANPPRHHSLPETSLPVVHGDDVHTPVSQLAEADTPRSHSGAGVSMTTPEGMAPGVPSAADSRTESKPAEVNTYGSLQPFRGGLYPGVTGSQGDLLRLGEGYGNEQAEAAGGTFAEGPPPESAPPESAMDLIPNLPLWQPVAPEQNPYAAVDDVVEEPSSVVAPSPLSQRSPQYTPSAQSSEPSGPSLSSRQQPSAAEVSLQTPSGWQGSAGWQDSADSNRPQAGRPVPTSPEARPVKNGLGKPMPQDPFHDRCEARHRSPSGPVDSSDRASHQPFDLPFSGQSGPEHPRATSTNSMSSRPSHDLVNPEDPSSPVAKSQFPGSHASGGSGRDEDGSSFQVSSEKRHANNASVFTSVNADEEDVWSEFQSEHGLDTVLGAEAVQRSRHQDPVLRGSEGRPEVGEESSLDRLAPEDEADPWENDGQDIPWPVWGDGLGDQSNTVLATDADQTADSPAAADLSSEVDEQDFVVDPNAALELPSSFVREREDLDDTGESALPWDPRDDFPNSPQTAGLPGTGPSISQPKDPDLDDQDTNDEPSSFPQADPNDPSFMRVAVQTSPSGPAEAAPTRKGPQTPWLPGVPESVEPPPALPDYAPTDRQSQWDPTFDDHPESRHLPAGDAAASAELSVDGPIGYLPGEHFSDEQSLAEYRPPEHTRSNDSGGGSSAAGSSRPGFSGTGSSESGADHSGFRWSSAQGYSGQGPDRTSVESYDPGSRMPGSESGQSSRFEGSLQPYPNWDQGDPSAGPLQNQPTPYQARGPGEGVADGGMRPPAASAGFPETGEPPARFEGLDVPTAEPEEPESSDGQDALPADYASRHRSNYSRLAGAPFGSPAPVQKRESKRQQPAETQHESKRSPKKEKETKRSVTRDRKRETKRSSREPSRRSSNNAGQQVLVVILACLVIVPTAIVVLSNWPPIDSSAEPPVNSSQDEQAQTIAERIEQLANPQLQDMAVDDLLGYGVQAVPQLSKALKRPDPKIRLPVIWILGEIGPEAVDAAPDLINLAELSEDRVVGLAIEAVRKMGPSATGSLLQAAQSKRTRVQVTATTALGQLLQKELPPDVGPQIVGVLSGLLQDDDLEVRVWATEGLGYGGTGAVEFLVDALKPERELDVRLAAAQGLKTVRPTEKAAVRGLAVLMTDGANLSDSTLSKRVLHKTAEALQAIGTPAVPELIQMFKHPRGTIIKQAAECLAAIDPPPISAMITALKDPSPLVKVGAADVLGRLAPKLGRQRDEVLFALKHLENQPGLGRSVSLTAQGAINRIKSASNR